ncbi:helix-turn-helix domain-containing protein [Glycomyces artemisiae]|uniref:PucR-like helix-turn-helix protein n=1 Tax=Glycomyces artemisiae TaxID=1076443 RepID=A0A2T0UHF9_9ACTN|nr:helix-turn-helix domain-containing protein [Glycomyces artemisiae]PRY57267.1 PucR-like helix-turn-helix protein [Glycomyces artemisiae]
MRELIGRLESSDDPAVAALRVIDHFDRLVQARATAAAVVRATAALAGCPAGLHDAETGSVRRFDPEGRPLPETEHASSVRLAVPGRIGAWVWLERPDATTGPLDPLLLERAAHTIQALNRPAPHTPAALVRVACDPDAAEHDRRSAVRALGLSSDVTVLVAVSPFPAAPLAAAIGRYTVALAPAPVAFPTDLRAGTALTGEPLDLPTAVGRAAIAFRLTDRVGGPGASVVRYEDLGAVAALVEHFSPPDAAAVPDVQRLNQALATRPWIIDTLQAALDQTSLRQAADRLHLHHSTLQERLAWLESRLDLALAKPGGRQRAAIALALWRIASSEDPDPETQVQGYDYDRDGKAELGSRPRTAGTSSCGGHVNAQETQPDSST